LNKTILQYQKAFKSVIDRLKVIDSVLAVMVFGSMVSGDLWDESDIDLFVITSNSTDNEISNIYAEEKDIAVHIKQMGKSKLIALYDTDIRGGFIHRVFSSSKLVFSKDKEITSIYDGGRFYPDVDRERWNMVYLGDVIKNISNCRKYLANDDLYNAYSTAVRFVEDYAKLYISLSGYMISKEAMTMVMNLNDGFKDCVDGLFFNKVDTIRAIQLSITYVSMAIDENIRNITSLLLNYMRQLDCFLSSKEIKRDRIFQNYDIEIEEVLNRLWEKNIIKKEKRDFRAEDGKVILKENVYYI